MRPGRESLWIRRSELCIVSSRHSGIARQGQPNSERRPLGPINSSSLGDGVAVAVTAAGQRRSDAPAVRVGHLEAAARRRGRCLRWQVRRGVVEVGFSSTKMTATRPPTGWEDRVEAAWVTIHICRFWPSRPQTAHALLDAHPIGPGKGPRPQARQKQIGGPETEGCHWKRVAFPAGSESGAVHF